MKNKTYIGWSISPGDWFAASFVAMLEKYDPEFRVRDVSHLNTDQRFALLFEVCGACMHTANTAIVRVSALMQVDPYGTYGKTVATNTVWLREESEIEIPTKLSAVY